jgi:hypothetical protein
MITGLGSVGLFVSCSKSGGEVFALMVKRSIGIRRAWLSAMVVTALLLATASIPASARQSSTTDSSAAKKPASTKTTTHKHSTSTASKTHSTSSGKRSSRKKTAKTRGQQKIDSERAQAIQEALIREHYMSGEASGTWNQASEDAMRKYQADHGWQSKTVPDSRALISLGLGPSKDHLLNPESAMTTGPEAPRAASLPTASHSTTPAADPAAPNSNPTDPSRPQ